MSDLPHGWVRAKLAEVVTPRGERVSPKSRVDEQFIGLEHVEAHSTRILGAVPASEVKSAASVFKSGDVLYGRLRPYLNKVAKPDFDGLASAEFIVFPDQKHLRSGYLKHRLNASDFVSFASRLNAGDRPRVDFEQIGDFAIELPPPREQQRVVEKLEELLSDLDAGTAALERARAKLKRYRAAVLKAAVEGRLTDKWRAAHPHVEPASKLLERILIERRQKWEEAQLRKYAERKLMPPKGWKETYKAPIQPDASRLPALPHGWCWTNVETVGDVLLGRRRAPEYVTGLHRRKYLRVANIKDDRIDFQDLEEMDFDETHFARYRLLPGDVLVSEGQSPELLGQSAIFKGEVRDLCFQATLHRFRAIYPEVSAQFAQVVFRGHVVSGVFTRLGSITTNIAHLTREKFCAAPFPLAPLEEQEEIVRYVELASSSIVHVTDQIKREKIRIANLRQGILKRAFEGKLVPQDPKDEPASELLESIRAVRESLESRRSPARRKRINGG